jgi:tetratricopeptide (TPR) repeat protein
MGGGGVKTQGSQRIVIMRDDHIGDPIGAIFLEPDDGEAGIFHRLRDYLGPKIKILRSDVLHDRVHLEVQGATFAEESSRLAAAAGELLRKGAPRNALMMYHEALALDPLNGNALHQMGALLEDRKRFREAYDALRRAREVLGDSVELLHALARVSVQMERVPTAVGYLEKALELEPNNNSLRRDLVALGRKPPPASMLVKSQRPPRRQHRPQ